MHSWSPPLTVTFASPLQVSSSKYYVTWIIFSTLSLFECQYFVASKSLFSQHFSPALGPRSLLVSWYCGTFLGVERLWYEFIAEVQNEWSYNSSPQYAFMAWRGSSCYRFSLRMIVSAFSCFKWQIKLVFLQHFVCVSVCVCVLPVQGITEATCRVRAQQSKWNN